MDMGLDFSKYDEQFYRAIDGLIELHFGKEAAELIFFYLYDRIGEDGEMVELLDTDDIFEKFPYYYLLIS